VNKGTVLLFTPINFGGQRGQVHCPSLELLERDNGPVPLIMARKVGGS